MTIGSIVWSCTLLELWQMCVMEKCTQGNKAAGNGLTSNTIWSCVSPEPFSKTWL